jgi:hypothetical protein
VAVHLTTHAKRQMELRRISQSDVELALRRQSGTSPGQPGSIWIEGHTAGGRILRVCVSVDDHEFVITAAWRDPR